MFCTPGLTKGVIGSPCPSLYEERSQPSRDQTPTPPDTGSAASFGLYTHVRSDGSSLQQRTLLESHYGKP